MGNLSQNGFCSEKHVLVTEWFAYGLIIELPLLTYVEKTVIECKDSDSVVKEMFSTHRSVKKVMLIDF